MSKHLVIDQIWIENRFRHRKRMTGKKLYFDYDSGFMVSSTSNGFTLDKKMAFLHRFKVCSNLLQISKSIGINIQTVYDHLAMDMKFKDEFNRLSQIDGKTKQLNNALIEVSKEEQKQFISNLASLAKSYK